MRIDDADPRWPYEQIADQLRAAITSGDIGPKLPTVEDMAEQARTSTTTIQRALKVLKDEGLVTGTPGRGLFVVRKP